MVAREWAAGRRPAAMYVGVVVFGTLLSEVQNAIGDMFEYQRQRVRMVQQLKDFLYVNVA